MKVNLHGTVTIRFDDPISIVGFELEWEDGDERALLELGQEYAVEWAIARLTSGRVRMFSTTLIREEAREIYIDDQESL